MLKRIALLALIFIVERCGATTIVTLVTIHAIVLCADSRGVLKRAGDFRPRKLSAGEMRKIFVVHDHFAVAHDGSAILEFSKFDGKTVVPMFTYSVARIVRDLQRDTTPAFTIRSAADLLRTKLVSQFEGFDVIPKSGALKREEGHPMEDDAITNFTVAGYDGSTAHVYQVGVGMNWNTLTHHVTPVATLYPEARKHISLFISGYSDAIQDLWKNNSLSTRNYAATFPIEYNALAHDLDLSIDQMIIMVRGLLGMQIERTPTKVAYPLTVVTIPPVGRITTRSYDK